MVVCREIEQDFEVSKEKGSSASRRTGLAQVSVVKFFVSFEVFVLYTARDKGTYVMLSWWGRSA